MKVGATGWCCAAVAVLVTLSWALLIPPLQVADETNHLAYAQYTAETGLLPGRADRPAVSSQQRALEEAVRFAQVRGNAAARPPSTPVEVAVGRQMLRAPGLRPDDGGGANSASANPPLWYLVAAVPYHLRGGDLLDRVTAMRLLGVLLAGLTVLGVFVFVREVTGGDRPAAAVGALVVALQPVFGFTSAGVTNDGALFAAGAWLFAALAVALRRGLTPRRGALVGGVLAAGVLSKFTLLGLVPAALAGLAIHAVRARRTPRWRERARGLALAAGLPLLAAAIYGLATRTVWERTAIVTAGVDPGAGARDSSVFGLLNYTWQFYLPRLPGTADLFGAEYPLYETWIRGLAGRFGWLDFGFGPTGASIFLVVVLAVLALAIAGLVARRDRARAHGVELATYAGMLLGLLAIIAIPGYTYLLDTSFRFEQARYLFPLLALYGAVAAFAVRGAGRLRPVVSVVLVLLAGWHTIASQLLTIERYFG